MPATKVVFDMKKVSANALAAQAGKPLPFNPRECGIQKTSSLVIPETKSVPAPLTDTTPIHWEDGWVYPFGELMLQDRKTISWNYVTQRYEGGYPY